MHTIVKVGRIYFANRGSLSSEKNGQNIRKILSGKNIGVLIEKFQELRFREKLKKNSCCVIPKELIFLFIVHFLALLYLCVISQE